MFFVLSKALLFLISPFFWLIVSIVVVMWVKPIKWKKRAKISAIVLFLFFTNTFIFSEFCSMWEVPGTKIKDLKQHDLGIVLSGMAEYDSSMERLSLRRGGDRIWQAISLYKTGKVKKLLITGKSGYISQSGLREAAQFKQVLIQWGIPKEDILTEEVSKNTHENAVQSKLVVDKYPELKSYVLITSGTHMKRSLACFRKQGMRCTPFSTDLYAASKRNYFWDQYFIPNVSNFDAWNTLIKEWVGYLTYRIAGYL